MALSVGVLCALYERERSGEGQVVDCSMVESSAYIATLFYGMLRTGHHQPRRGVNMVDGGAHFYNVYPTADGQWVAVAAVLPKFYENFLKALDLDPATLSDQLDAAQWPAMKARLTDIFRAQPLAYWKLSRTPGWVKSPAQPPGMQSRELLADWGFDAGEIETLHQTGAVRSARAAGG
jgi:alpha-methylacyl-CoA racemase